MSWGSITHHFLFTEKLLKTTQVHNSCPSGELIQMVAGVKYHPELLLRTSKEAQHWGYFGCALVALWGMYFSCPEKTSETKETKFRFIANNEWQSKLP